jgi:hypothetical protein
MPGTRPEQLTLAYWLARYSAAELDAPLMSEAQVRAYDLGVGRAGDDPASQRDLLRMPGPALLQHELRERLGHLRERLSDGRYGDAAGSAMNGAALAAFDAPLPPLAPELRVALDMVPVRCGPFDAGLFERKPGSPPKLLYDRNACSTARAQEVVQVLAPWPGGMLLARTRYALGFIDRHAALSPPLPVDQQEAFVHGPRARAATYTDVAGTGGDHNPLPKNSLVPLLDDGEILIADSTGVHARPNPGLLPTRRVLTRRALLTTAFEFIDSPYAFGDAGGGRDCSRLQMDLFEAFDLALPRHSGWQAEAGTFSVALSGMSDAEKVATIGEAQASGAVLLHLPGHVMLYLGKGDHGEPMALHALGEYVQPCPDGQGETIIDLQRTVVSDLSIGAGSSRKSLLQRLTSLMVLGGPPSPALGTRAQMRALPRLQVPETDAPCQDSTDARIFISPARPVAGTPLRFIATTEHPLAAPALWLFGPDGALIPEPRHRLGGPKVSVWSSVDAPSDGRYTAIFVDGNKTVACKHIPVRKGTLASEARSSSAEPPPVWMPRWSWERDTLNLWSAFVEQLFDDPPDDERTWTDLHTLLRDPARNLLHDHLGLGEDERLTMVPDCADLPFALRAYFSWKLRLPFGYRLCSRGRPGAPPRCGPVQSSLATREADDEVEAFSTFVNRRVESGVQSATGRTHPADSETDLYPVALAQGSLPPGTVYADPYGHVMILTKWYPQGKDPNAYGILMAAEAQPDNTLGRRRFFPGSFLFDPSTTDVGAGFKQFRPLTYDAANHAMVAADNDTLAHSEIFAPFSTQQYEGSKDDFYDRMDRLINPMPLDPHARLTSLLDAFEEAVHRRVLAVDNGEQFMAQNPARLPMPIGAEIFETTGPWEDYASPSRDMRLLIALDTVLAVPAQVEKAPERYNLHGAGEAKAAAAALRIELDHELRRRTFAYTRSDGAKQPLTLQDVLQRSVALEIAYNPNDCAELRWGAPASGPEIASCRRHSPADQQAHMQKYRAWFHNRARPPRDTGE